MNQDEKPISLRELYARVKLNVNMVDTIRKYTILNDGVQNDGTFFSGDCPFCKDAYLLVNKKSNLFYCFSCHATGDIMDFVAKIGGMKKSTAARFLDNISKKKGVIDAIETDFKQ